MHPFERLRVADCGDVDVVPVSIEGTFAAIERTLAPVVEARAVPLCVGGDHYRDPRGPSRAGAPARPARARALRRAPRHLGPLLRACRYYHGSRSGGRSRRADRCPAHDPGGHPRSALRPRGLRLPPRARARGASHRGREGARGRLGGGAPARLAGWPLVSLLRHRRVDPAYAPATGTPEAGGVTSYEALSLVRALRRARAGGGRHRGGLAALRRARAITGVLAANLALRAVSVVALGREGATGAKMTRREIGPAPVSRSSPSCCAPPRCLASPAGLRGRTRWRPIDDRLRDHARSRCGWSRRPSIAPRAEGAQALVIQLNTPGGLERSMRSMVQTHPGPADPGDRLRGAHGGPRRLRRGLHHHGGARGRDGARHQHRRRAPGGGRAAAAWTRR